MSGVVRSCARPFAVSVSTCLCSVALYISNFRKLTNKSKEIYKINKDKLVRNKCDCLDKYNTCCYVYDKEIPIIKSRFDDFGKEW